MTGGKCPRSWNFAGSVAVNFQKGSMLQCVFEKNQFFIPDLDPNSKQETDCNKGKEDFSCVSGSRLWRDPDVGDNKRRQSGFLHADFAMNAMNAVVGEGKLN